MGKISRRDFLAMAAVFGVEAAWARRSRALRRFPGASVATFFPKGWHPAILTATVFCYGPGVPLSRSRPRN